MWEIYPSVFVMATPFFKTVFPPSTSSFLYLSPPLSTVTLFSPVSPSVLFASLICFLQVDVSEAESVYSMLCALVESNNSDLFGPNMKNLPYVMPFYLNRNNPLSSAQKLHQHFPGWQVIRVLVIVCGTEMATPVTRFREFLRVLLLLFSCFFI